MNEVIIDLRKIKSAYSHDNKLMLQKVKEKLQEHTEVSNEINIENLGINNSLGNEVLDVLRISRNSQNINSGEFFEILELLGKLPMFPDVRKKVTDFRASIELQNDEQEKLGAQAFQKQTSEVSKPKDPKDYKKLIVLFLAFIFIVSTIALLINFINRPKEKITFYLDSDLDGYGIPNDSVISEKAPNGYVINRDDLDDNNPCIPDSTTQACQNLQSPFSGEKNPTTQPGTQPTTSASPPTNPNNGQATGQNNGGNAADGTSTQTSSPRLLTFYQDTDKDELGDPSKPTQAAAAPARYADNNLDACPTRRGPSSNKGCPVINVNVNRTINVDEKTTLKLEYDEYLPTDQIRWESKSLTLSSALGKEIEISSKIVGKYRVSYKISNKSDGFEIEDSQIIAVRMSNSRLEKELMNLAEYGNNKLLNIKSLEEKSNESKDFLSKCIDTNISLNKVSIAGSSSSQQYDKFIDELLSVKRSVHTHIKKIKVTKIGYDENSGKISTFSYSIN